MQGKLIHTGWWFPIFVQRTWDDDRYVFAVVQAGWDAVTDVLLFRIYFIHDKLPLFFLKFNSWKNITFFPGRLSAAKDFSCPARWCSVGPTRGLVSGVAAEMAVRQMFPAGVSLVKRRQNPMKTQWLTKIMFFYTLHHSIFSQANDKKINKPTNSYRQRRPQSSFQVNPAESDDRLDDRLEFHGMINPLTSLDQKKIPSPYY